MAWMSGNFLFPTSTGAFTVSGVPFEPQMAFFIGTNSAVEDSRVTASTAGMFFGMAWIDKDSGLPDSQCVALIMQAGINVKPNPIVMPATTGCDVDYAASLTSFNPDGFTLNVTNAASANRPITWLVGGDFDGAAGSANLGSAIYSVGFKVLTAFAMNYRTSSEIRDGCENGQYTSLYIGAASYPEVDQLPTYDTRSWGSGGTSRFSITGTQGFTRDDFNINPSPQFESAINISTGDFPPIVLEDRIQLWRLNDTQIQTAIGGGPLRWMAHWWTGESWHNSHPPPSGVGNTNSFVSGNPFLNDIQAAITINILGPEAEGLNAKSRLSVGIISADAQGVVAANDTGHLFQSRQYAVCGACDGTGVHAAAGTLNGNLIDFETFLQTQSPFLGGIFAFGSAVGGWIPQIYRRWPY